MGAVHEFSVFQFLSGIPYQEQAATMRGLETILKGCGGYLRREYFHNPTDRRWVDHIVWSDLASAVESEKALEDPTVAVLFNGIDPSSVVFTRTVQVDSVH